MKPQPETTTAPEYVLAVAPAEQLQAAIAAAEAERDAYEVRVRTEFDRQMAYFSGRIDALRSLLPAPVAPDEPPDASPA